MKRELSLVNPDKQEFPELPEKQVMSAPGALKGDGSGKKAGDVPGDSPENYTGFAPTLYEWKMTAKAFYLTDTIQLVVAGVIFLNFIVVMFSVTQFVLDNKNMEEFTDLMDTIFISFFLAELVLNMGTTMNVEDQAELFSPFFWQWEFVVGGNWAWNWFDFIVIVVPIVMSQGWASSIRILRLFRVIRVLKSIAKFEALQVVASSISRSVGGIGAVAVMIFGLMCCYAITGVVFFGRKEFHEACTKMAEPDKHHVKLIYAYAAGDTLPAYAEGDTVTYKVWAKLDRFDNTIFNPDACGDYEALYDCFANLRRALYTTFMMMTLESWPDLCWASVTVYKYGAAYFVSFVAINALMMANLIIAVFTTQMDKVADVVKKEAAESTQRRRQMSAAIFSENSTVQGVDLDGDGIADEFVVDLDGDGVADVVMSADEMNQVWRIGDKIEVYSHTIMQWCSGEVKEVNMAEKRIKVEYDVDGNTLGEKTIPFKHDSIRRPAGATVGGSGPVVAGKHTTIAKGGGVGNSDDIMKLLRQIAKNVDTLMADKAQKV